MSWCCLVLHIGAYRSSSLRGSVNEFEGVLRVLVSDHVAQTCEGALRRSATGRPCRLQPPRAFCDRRSQLPLAYGRFDYYLVACHGRSTLRSRSGVLNATANRSGREPARSQPIAAVLRPKPCAALCSDDL